MRAIILAAGQGTRLRPITDDRPKCMVPFQGRPIIDHILDAMDACNVDAITIVSGYRDDVLREHLSGRDISFVQNVDFETTNMVHSFFCAEAQFDQDILVSYADIVYRPSILQALIDEASPRAATIDLDWEKLWSIRMEDPLADAETLKLDEAGNILEVGKKPTALADIQGQYMGLVKFRASALNELKEVYHGLDPAESYDGQSLPQLYFTSLLQLLIDNVGPIKAVPIHGGWVEIDSVEDLALLESYY